MEETGQNQTQIGKLIGMSQQTISNLLKGKGGPDAVMAVIKKWPESKEFILNNPDDKPEPEAYEVAQKDVYDQNVMPVPLIRAYASLPERWDQEEMNNYPIYLTKKRTDGDYVCFEVAGDSMTSTDPESIYAGDYLVCRELQRHHWKNRLHIPRVFVLVHRERGVMVKQVIAHDVPNGILTCHSFNPEYEDFQVQMDDLDKIYYAKDREGAYRF